MEDEVERAQFQEHGRDARLRDAGDRLPDRVLPNSELLEPRDEDVLEDNAVSQHDQDDLHQIFQHELPSDAGRPETLLVSF